MSSERVNEQMCGHCMTTHNPRIACFLVGEDLADERINNIARNGNDGIAYSTPDEDEAWNAMQAKQPAYEPDDVAFVRAEECKQPRYQDETGEDWIDEAARTFTPEEFRGAMRFSIGKYVRRAGKKDALESEIEKMRDYAARWLEVEKGR